MDSLGDIGVGGVLGVLAMAFVLVREAMRLVAKSKTEAPKEGGSEALSLLKKMEPQINELFRLHDQRDKDGVPVWYVRRSLEDAIGEMAKSVALLAQNINQQTMILDRMDKRQETLRHEIEEDIKRHTST